MADVSSIVACIYEDRPSCIVGLTLLGASLRRHAPDLELVVFSSEPQILERDWRAVSPRMSVRSWTPRRRGWNVKPELILHLLRSGAPTVLWLDSDLIVARPLAELLNRTSNDTFVAAPEPFWYADNVTNPRTRLWGFRQLRNMPAVTNACFLRFSQSHLPLIERWADLLDTPEYVRTQGLPVLSRPKHMLSDQDVLTALLGSDEFPDLKFAYLNLGRDIVHCFDTIGHRPSERLAEVLHGAPTLIHAQGAKPWVPLPRDSGVRQWAYTAIHELSRYNEEARSYASVLGEDTGWLTLRHPLARALTVLCAGQRQAASYLLSLPFSAHHWIRRAIGRGPVPNVAR